MITSEYLSTMARYNCWQNQSIYTACNGLSDFERKKDRGAFFGSIHRTLGHLLWGDMIWMSRFYGSEPPEISTINGSGGMVEDWEELKRRRHDTDAMILKWADGIKVDELSGDLTWFSGAIGREVSKPYGFLVVGFFNHQTHHRGQAHAMVTAAGGKPDDTDLFIMPDNVTARPL